MPPPLTPLTTRYHSPPPLHPLQHTPSYKEHNQVYSWLVANHMERYSPTLVNNGFDSLASVATLNEQLLDALEIRPLGHRALLLSAVNQLRSRTL